MPASNFPNGFANGVTIRGVPIEIPHSGEVFWVNGSTSIAKNAVGGSDGNPGTYTQPFATVDYAIGKCTASRGDVIYVMPGHTETVTATSIAFDVAGVNIICLGHGENVPTFTFGAAAATITVSAANCSWSGGKFLANFDNVAAAITLGAAANFTLQGVLLEDSTAALHFLSAVVTGTTDNAADGLVVSGNKWVALALAPNAFVSILGDIARIEVSDNDVNMLATNDVGHFITFAAKDATASFIRDNTLIVTGATDAAVGIFLTGSGTGMTGVVSGNLVSSLDTTTELIATAGTGLDFFNNYYTGVADASGKLWPAVDAA
jgi:hypothetical protein